MGSTRKLDIFYSEEPVNRRRCFDQVKICYAFTILLLEVFKDRESRIKLLTITRNYLSWLSNIKLITRTLCVDPAFDICQRVYVLAMPFAGILWSRDHIFRDTFPSISRSFSRSFCMSNNTSISWSQDNSLVQREKVPFENDLHDAPYQVYTVSRKS